MYCLIVKIYHGFRVTFFLRYTWL